MFCSEVEGVGFGWFEEVEEVGFWMGFLLGMLLKKDVIHFRLGF